MFYRGKNEEKTHFNFRHLFIFYHIPHLHKEKRMKDEGHGSFNENQIRKFMKIKNFGLTERSNNYLFI